MLRNRIAQHDLLYQSMATIKDLIGKGPDELEKLSEAELRIHCAPYLMIGENVVVENDDEDDGQRDLLPAGEQADPTLVGYKPGKRRPPKKSSITTKEDLHRQMMELAKIHGVELGDMGTPIKG